MTRRVSILLVLSLAASATASEPPAASSEVDYLSQVKPLLQRHCFSCHGALKQRGGLRLDAAQLILDGGDDGPAVRPGRPAESVLVRRLRSTDPDERMPKDGEPLEHEEIEVLERWIAAGARAPEEPVPEDPRRHWAFQSPERPAVPAVRRRAWVRNPLDAFIAAEHEKRGLEPAPEAEKRVLLRRVHLDLTGLPPTPADVSGFLDDASPDAYEKVVDRLLASPRHGERWGRHWMDVWRYSDWYGYQKELRNSQLHIWRWRDWIIESLNEDRSYGRMVVEMLAGDEVAPLDPATLRATGFLARNYYKFNRNVWLEDVVEHTAKAFIGITMNCARCHDHMYDPVAQKDYYRFRAIFEPHRLRYDPLPGADPDEDAVARAYDADAKAPTYLFLRGDEKHPVKDRPLAPGVPAVLARNVPLEIEPIDLAPAAFYPGLKPFVQEAAIEGARERLAEAEKLLAAALEALGAAQAAAQGDVEKARRDVRLAQKRQETATLEVETVAARIAADRARYAPAGAGGAAADAADLSSRAALLERRLALGRAEQKLEEAEQGLAAAASTPGDKLDKAKKERDTARAKLEEARKGIEDAPATHTPLGEVYPGRSTGRRLALARWITAPGQPLAARVAVNHVWLRHFGAGLVETVFDFGVSGARPSHPGLLDWLAVELLENDWSLKHLHRLILTSATYRMTSASAEAEANLGLDRDNRYLWRMNRRRLEGEAVRDSVLSLSGRLDLRLGGPELSQSEGQTTYRRSVYYRHAHEKYMPFLQLFDGAGVFECYRRDVTVVPQQALALANSPLAIEQSRLLARTLTNRVGAEDTAASRREFVAAAFERVLGRPPGAREGEECAAFLEKQAALLRSRDRLKAFDAGEKTALAPAPEAHLRARENLVHVLINHNDFVTVR